LQYYGNIAALNGTLYVHVYAFSCHVLLILYFLSILVHTRIHAVGIELSYLRSRTSLHIWFFPKGCALEHMLLIADCSLRLAGP